MTQCDEGGEDKEIQQTCVKSQMLQRKYTAKAYICCKDKEKRKSNLMLLGTDCKTEINISKP